MVRLIADRARVRVPATSGNLGPGFDAFGLALGLYDVIDVSLVTGATQVQVEGEGAGEVPDGEDHLVVQAIRAGLDYAGASQAGLSLHCHNAIPHGRGLGSSAAAVVAGLVAARALVSEPEALDDAAILALATEFEGHPDNAAPALLGAATIAWLTESGPRAERLEVAADLAATVLVPTARLATKTARAALPSHVPHRDAAINSGRTGLLTLALTQRPDLLFPATVDHLHQQYRASSMPASMDAVVALREQGWAAVVSGAGPSVLILHEGAGPEPDALAAIAGTQWRQLALPIERDGVTILT